MKREKRLPFLGGVAKKREEKEYERIIFSPFISEHGKGLRKNEGDDVERIFRNTFDMNLIRVNAEDRFLGKLKGVTEPEAKRKIIGEEFIRVFEEESNKLGKMDFLVQGTIYPDIVESGLGGESATIKSHHNVGGLPEDVDFQIVEPLKELFKDLLCFILFRLFL